jgi:hypothetical protein
METLRSKESSTPSVSKYLSLFIFLTTLTIRFFKYHKCVRGYVKLKIHTIIKHIASKVNNTYIFFNKINKSMTTNISIQREYFIGGVGIINTRKENINFVDVLAPITEVYGRVWQSSCSKEIALELQIHAAPPWI